MNLGEAALTAFTASAGVSPDKMSLLIRTVLLALTFLWAAWCIYGEVQFFKHHDTEIIDMVGKCSRILLIVSLVVTLIFIS